MSQTDDSTAVPLPTLMLGGSPWAIRLDVLPRIAESIRASSTPAWMQAAEGTLTGAPKAARRQRAARTAGGGVAVLPLTGILSPRGSLLSLLFGGGFGGLQDFREAFAEAVNSPDVGSIVIDVDSPGGLTDLVPETAAEVRDARGSKPIIAIANTQAASAAYWIASQADEIVATPSAFSIGSIGVYLTHEDWSRFDQNMGVATTFIHAGKYKVEANSLEPLADDARAKLQQDVDDVYALFLEDVATGRGISVEEVRDGYGEGRVFPAARALEMGMVDRIDTIDTVIAELLTGDAAASAAALAAAPAPSPPADPAPAPAPAAVEPPAEPPTVPALDPADRARRAAVLLG